MSKFTIASRLFIITAIAALFLAVTNMITAPITKANNEKAFNQALKEALPKAKDFKAVDFSNSKDNSVTINSIHAGYIDEAHENLAGYVVKATTSEGYGGDLCVIVGLDKSGEIIKVIISSPFNETPGLGAKAKNSDFINQFKGKNSELEVVKRKADGDAEISAISSATITSKAVTACVNASREAVLGTAAKTNSLSDEAQQVYQEKDKQSQQELDAVEENRKNEPTPMINDENIKEGN